MRVPLWKPVAVPIDSVKPDPENARRHPARNVEVLRESLQRFGQVLPVVLHKGVVVAGNARLELLRQLGAREVLVVDVSSWADEDAAAYAAVDNRAAELGTWDPEKLRAWADSADAELAEALGFSDPEVSSLLGEAEALLHKAAPEPPGEGTARDPDRRTVRLVFTPAEEERFLRAAAEARPRLGVSSTPEAVLAALEQAAGIDPP